MASTPFKCPAALKEQHTLRSPSSTVLAVRPRVLPALRDETCLLKTAFDPGIGAGTAVFDSVLLEKRPDTPTGVAFRVEG